MLKMDVDAEDVYSLPFTCKTLVELKLTGFSIDVLPEDASLPALKTLILTSVQFYSLHACAFEKLLTACLVLQDLVLYDFNWEQWKWSRVVSSPSLERLAIEGTEFYDFDGSDFESITFDTPNVIHLDYHDLVPGSYPIVNLDSLVEANLDLVVTVDHIWDVGFADENDPITRNPTNLIKGLRNVKVMKLTHQSLEMFYFFHKAIPVFKNLVQLSIGPIACWRGLPFLVNKSPILETLSIEGYLHYGVNEGQSSVCECLSGYSFLLSCPLKVLKITEYYGTTEEVELLKHFLVKLPCLELLKVKTCPRADKFQITKDLLMLPSARSRSKNPCLMIEVEEKL